MRKILLFVLLSTAAKAADLKNESEAGIILTTGNSQTKTFHLTQQSTYTSFRNTLSFQGSYLQSSSDTTSGAYNWSLGIRYEREISQPFSLFAAQTVMADHPRGIETRSDTDVGGKYFFFKQEDLKFFLEAGYRYSYQDNLVPPAEKNHKLRLYTEANRAWTDSVSTKISLEYLQNFSVAKDEQINTELALITVLSSVLSLKTSYVVQYDRNPPFGKLTTDSTLTTSLVAKY